MKNRVTVKILDSNYTLVTEESEEYSHKVAKTVDGVLRSMLESDTKVSVAMASIYAAFNFCDEKIRAEESCDNLRGQLKSYLEDMNKIRANYDELKKENTRLSNEVSSMKGRLTKLTKGNS